MTISILATLSPITLPLSILLGARIAAYIDNATWAV